MGANILQGRVDRWGIPSRLHFIVRRIQSMQYEFHVIAIRDVLITLLEHRHETLYASKIFIRAMSDTTFCETHADRADNRGVRASETILQVLPYIAAGQGWITELEAVDLVNVLQDRSSNFLTVANYIGRVGQIDPSIAKSQNHCVSPRNVVNIAATELG